jgi:hypothetical protein
MATFLARFFPQKNLVTLFPGSAAFARLRASLSESCGQQNGNLGGNFSAENPIIFSVSIFV